MIGGFNPSSNYTGSETAANLNSSNAKSVAVKAKWTANCSSGLSVNGSKSFSYTGGIQTFTACSGETYKLEVWGAQGGDVIGQTKYSPGMGGYSYGTKSFSADTTLYIVIGGQGGNVSGTSGDTSYHDGGYNGGGKGYGDAGGGGATHIATSTGVLSSFINNKSSVLIVAGGGGGEGNNRDSGSGGGASGGVQTSNPSDSNRGTGGTQTTAGTVYTACDSSTAPQSSYSGGFGYGGNSTESSSKGGGGGGGWYGGGGACGGEGGGGGSGYIDGVSSGSTSNGVRSGDGYATITRQS